MAVQLNTSTYSDLVSSINSLLSSGQYRSVSMSIFNDAECTQIATDSNGNSLMNRSFSQTTSKSETKDENENIINGSIIVSFNDGCEFVCTDNVDSYWYIMSGISILSR